MSWNTNTYAREKFIEAVEKLATGEGDVRRRLRSAYGALRILRLQNLPQDMWDDWRWVQHQMTKFGPLYVEGKLWHGSVEHTMSRIRNRTGSEITKRIYRMQGTLTLRRYNE